MDSPAEPNDLLVDIIETLEARGLDADAFHLQDYVDVDALDQLVNAPYGDVEVRFTVDGIRLAVTPDSVDVLTDESEE
ncbi:HalOD1 output domain-containing protein [Halorubrum sp. CSM-61]|uniref:HalOD1 output domain-containing protein n=1 Tax=Halorubrum sp. CSM-61 TaxID=2485838 RepID=UPI001F154343|nr:HalOD1 output domain-containing protein [Halorubrum sp. CSM-61]